MLYESKLERVVFWACTAIIVACAIKVITTIW